MSVENEYEMRVHIYMNENQIFRQEKLNLTNSLSVPPAAFCTFFRALHCECHLCRHKKDQKQRKEQGDQIGRILGSWAIFYFCGLL
jgi:hypothetical protein